jgi:penicillin-binding protein 1A
LALLLVLFALAAASFSYGLITAIRSELDALDPSKARGDVDTVVYSAPNRFGERRVLAILRGDESRVLVASKDISPIMKQAIVAVEDKRFYEHNGVDVRGIVRALWQDIRSQSVVEGGSTITQQYVKNAYSRNEQTIGRKVREAALAWQLTQRWSKDRILTAYLNTIYFGNGAYGVLQAARTYFHGKSAAELTLPEAALLAGIPASPSLYDPVQHPVAARERRSTVLDQLFDQGRITAAERGKADAAPLPKPEEVRLPGTRGPAPYFVNYVTDQLVAEYGAERVFGGGLEVTTTIDLELQEQAREAIQKVLHQSNGPAAALVAINPRTGGVKAMFGGTNFRRSQFNLATQAERQPGSSFKPIVLASAFRQGIAPSTRIASKPIEIDAGDRVWKVSNYEGTYLGEVDLARAMISSDNSVYAQLTKIVGPRSIVDTAKQLGIRSKLPAYFSIGLGAVAVNPLDMTRAYATIANDGQRVDGSIMGDRPRVVRTVKLRRTGEVRQNEPVRKPILTKSQAETITSILEQVVEQGTGKRADLGVRTAAGKTGTTDDYGDAWFVGYTPELAVAVWVGYPNELRPMETEFNGEPVAGGTLPALIWKAFMSKALADEPPRSFNPAPYLPSTSLRVVFRDGRWRRDNGYCPNTRVISYFSESPPSTTARCYANEVSVPTLVGRSIESARSALASVPLTPDVIYVPAEPKTRPGEVVRQLPRSGGFLSANGTVRIFVTAAPDGLVPNLVGSSLPAARERSRKLRLKLRVRYGEGPSGTVLQQSVEAGIAVRPGLPITLLVGRGSTS